MIEKPEKTLEEWEKECEKDCLRILVFTIFLIPALPAIWVIWVLVEWYLKHH